MDNYLSLKGRGLAKRKKFIFFPLYPGGFQPELSNYFGKVESRRQKAEGLEGFGQTSFRSPDLV